MKFLRSVLWGMAIFAVCFSFKMRNKATVLHFCLKEPQFFTKIFCQFVSVHLLRPLPKNSQNFCNCRILVLETGNIVAHILDIVHQICKMIFLDVAITFVNEKLQLSSTQYAIYNFMCAKFSCMLLPTKDCLDVIMTVRWLIRFELTFLVAITMNIFIAY